MHDCDARVKMLLLLVYSVTLFLVSTWAGLTLYTAVFLAAMISSKIPANRFFNLMVPLYVVVGFTVIFNAFALDVNQITASTFTPGWLSSASVSVQSLSPLTFVGSFGLVPAGLSRGCFFALRIILLMMGSLVISYTTTSTDLTNVLSGFLRPLRRAHVPVDDVVMVFSLALRFIPVTAEEFGRVHDAQWSRGAAFSEGKLWERLGAWQTVLIPLFVGLFRRADTLAAAMDARCYGAGERSCLNARPFKLKSALVLFVGIALCAVLAWWL